MNRREFLSLAGGTAGYSVFVRLDAQPVDAPLERREALTRLAPPITDRAAPASEPHMTEVALEADVCVAGGGMAGVCAAVAAARQGARVVLIQDRSRLGGNASSEVKMHIVGADNHGGRPGWREGGLIEELRLEDAVRNPHRSFELWDLLLYDKVMSEPNITLLLDSTLFAVSTAASRITQVTARCDKTEHLYRVVAPLYLDCTGDCRLGVEASAEYRVGREAKNEFNESLAYDRPDAHTQGSSILFTARDYGKPIPFTPPAWARKVAQDQLRFRPINSWEYGYWWIEWGGQLNTIRDNERIRFELLAIVLGVWDYIKNSGQHPDSAPWGMDWIGMIPGKRESRRLVGDHVLTQHDLEGKAGEPADAVAIGGWPMDDHPPSGFDRPEDRPYRSARTPDVYSIPLRCLYSRNIENLFMAGRNISASHVAFSSARVMATCSVLGQAAGTAAALCARDQLTPRQWAQDPARVRELQQLLLRSDQTLKTCRNEDPLDLARQAQVTASSCHDLTRPEAVINGWVRDRPGEWKNRWAASLADGPAWLELRWGTPCRLREIQLTFDSGFHRELTLSASASVNLRIIRGPQPEIVRDYTLVGLDPDGGEHVLAEVEDNLQRLRRHTFEPLTLQAIRLDITATQGYTIASVFEVRAYA